MKSLIVALAAILVIGGEARAQESTTPWPVFDVHMHAPSSTGYPEWRAAMSELNVRNAVLIGTMDQLAAAPADETRFLPSLVMPCEGGGAVSFGARCFEDGAEFPSPDAIRAMSAEGRLKALGEVTAQYMNVAADDPRMEPYYALAEELDLPIGLHLGIGPPAVAYAGHGALRFPPRKSVKYRGAAGDPMRLEEVLLRHPRLRLYVMHAAWPFREDMMYMMYMHPQLYVDVSVLQWAIPRPAYYAYLRELVDAGLGKRIMFGSDGGVRHLREGVEAIMQADFLTEEQKRDILHDNAARFFRIEPAPPSA